MGSERVPSDLAERPAAEQVAWFDVHSVRLTLNEWDRYFVASTEHRGLCCNSCLDDLAEGYCDILPHCCCLGLGEELRGGE